MLSSKVSSIFLIFICFSGCTTPGFKATKIRYGTQIEARSDRFLLECEALENGNYGFMIHVLDEENSVTNVIQGNEIDKESCSKRVLKIGRILNAGKRITLVGHGELEGPRSIEERMYTFTNLGTYPWNGRVLHFKHILNEKGQCFDAHYEERKPCPRDY